MKVTLIPVRKPKEYEPITVQLTLISREEAYRFIKELGGLPSPEGLFQELYDTTREELIRQGFMEREDY